MVVAILANRAPELISVLLEPREACYNGHGRGISCLLLSKEKREKQHPRCVSSALLSAAKVASPYSIGAVMKKHQRNLLEISFPMPKSALKESVQKSS